MDTGLFFERIGLPADTKIEHTVEFLGKIQSGAVTHIAYENLDILAGKPLKLDYASLKEKIVMRRRGGYCFELNGFLSGVLSEMGFCVKERFARFLRGEKEIPMRRHRVTVVELNGKKYLLDIGVGQIAPRFPLLISENEIQKQGEETYRFTKDVRHGWILWDMKDGAWREYIAFTDDDAYEIDFVQPSFFCEKHPESVFNKQKMLSIKTEKGRKTVDGDTYKVFEGETLVYIEENVPKEKMIRILREEFLLNIGEGNV